MKIAVDGETFKLEAVRQENPNLWLVTETVDTKKPTPSISASNLTDLMTKIRSLVKPSKSVEDEEAVQESL